MMGWYGDWGWGWGGWLGMILAMVVFWGGLAAIVIFLLRRTSSGSGTSTTQPDALRILEERFARGEIDEEEYRARRDVLTRRR